MPLARIFRKPETNPRPEFRRGNGLRVTADIPDETLGPGECMNDQRFNVVPARANGKGIGLILALSGQRFSFKARLSLLSYQAGLSARRPIPTPKFARRCLGLT
jgi:hypothetical protein